MSRVIMAAFIAIPVFGMPPAFANGDCLMIGKQLAPEREARLISAEATDDGKCEIVLVTSGANAKRLICEVDPAQFGQQGGPAPASDPCYPDPTAAKKSIEDYWTDERMKNAQPMGMGVLD